MASKNNFNRNCYELKSKLREAVEEVQFDGSLLSGGLDTSIINHLSAQEDSSLNCISVGFRRSQMEDLKYAKIMARKLELQNHHIYTFDFDEAKDAAEEVVRIVQSFDPIEIRNDISLFVALKKAKEKGYKRILTGDGSDELLAGYSYIYEQTPKKMRKELKKIRDVMTFSSETIAEDLGIEVELPFLDEEVKKFTENIEPEYLVGERNGGKYGKWILRKAFEDDLPEKIIWRKKAPIEKGSGTAILPDLFESEMKKSEFQSKIDEIKEKDGVIIRSEEQLFYYNIYKSLFGAPEPEAPEGRKCPYCNSSVPEKTTFCRICGNGLDNN